VHKNRMLWVQLINVTSGLVTSSVFWTKLPVTSNFGALFRCIPY